MQNASPIGHRTITYYVNGAQVVAYGAQLVWHVIRRDGTRTFRVMTANEAANVDARERTAHALSAPTR